jgi:hypothetical protein
MAMAKPGEWQVRAGLNTLPGAGLYNARYWVAPAGRPVPRFARPINRFGRYAVYEVPTGGYFALGAVEPLPATVFADRAVRGHPWSEIYDTGLEWLRSRAPREHRYLAMDGPVEPLGRPGAEGSLLEETVRPGRFGCTVSVTAAADVILKVTHHPFWRCTVDGRDAPIVRVFPSFMAVRVPEGTHRIEFDYRPPGWKKALFFLSLGLLAVAAGAAILRRGRGRRAPRPS